MAWILGVTAGARSRGGSSRSCGPTACVVCGRLALGFTPAAALPVAPYVLTDGTVRLQTPGGEGAASTGSIRLLPAWPAEWTVNFRPPAPGRTVVEGRVETGTIRALRVTPESRRADIESAENKTGLRKTE